MVYDVCGPSILLSGRNPHTHNPHNRPSTLTSTILQQRIPIEPVSTMLAMRSSRLIQTLLTIARPPIAIAHPIQIHIPIATAPLAAAARHLRIPEIIVRTHFAPPTRIALLAITHHVQRARIPLAIVRVRVIRCQRARTVARPAAHLAAQRRITVVALHAAIALRAGGVVAALVALAGVRVARRRMPVALALLAIVEVPETRLALVALAAVRVGPTAALAGDLVAFAIKGADLVAVARLAAFRSEAVSARRAAIALAADHVRLAQTRTAVGVAFLRHRTGWVAVAGCGPDRGGG